MDLATENRIATMLLEEARRLRAQAEKEGIQAYLDKPNVRVRPNSRFLTNTVLGVQQANRAVEVNEMWRAREKEKELENKKHKSNSRERESRNYTNNLRTDQDKRKHLDASCSSQKYDNLDSNSDDELEEFLRSRKKRGRGDIGPRMDEPGPYLPFVDQSDTKMNKDLGFKERRIVGPEKPSFLTLNNGSSSKDKGCSKDKKDKKKKKREKEKREKGKREKRKREKEKSHKRRRREYDDD